MATELETRIAQFETDLGLAHDIVHGGIAVEVVTEGGTVKSLARLVKDAEDNVVAPATAEALAAKAAAEAARDVSVGAAGTASADAATASGAKTDAEAARDVAVGAKTDAEAARDVAVGAAGTASADAATAVAAKDDAETARDQAQALVNPALQAVAAADIDLASGAAVFAKTFVAGAIAITVSNWPAAGTVGSFLFKMANAGLADIAWPAGLTWAGGVEPAWSSDATDIAALMSDDGGATIYAGLVFFGLNPGA